VTFVGSAIPSGEISALTDDAPLIMATNVLDTATQVKWTAGGTEGEADITDTTQPVTRVRDRYLHLGTTRTPGSAATHYFNFSLLDAVDFDCIFLRIGSAAAISSIDFQTAAAGTFASPTTHKTWTALSSVTSNGARLVGLSLNSNQRFSGTGYGRIVFSMGASSSAPSIYELWLSRRRQISRRSDQGSGYDDAPIGATRDRVELRGGLVTGLTRARGFQNFRGGFSPSGFDQYALDDVSTLRAIATDTDYLGNPTIVWIDRPTTDAGNAVVGELSFSQGGLSLPFTGWATRSVDYSISELPPFALREPRIIT
jgi:hypothetical protein